MRLLHRNENGTSRSLGYPAKGCENDLICLRFLTRQFAGTASPAVDQVKLCVRQGEVLAILGPSGAGKSTLLRLIAGFERPDGGELLVQHRTVSSSSVCMPPEQRGVGMVFQEYALFPHLSVQENVAFGLRIKDRKERQARVQEALDLVGLKGLEHRYPHELSGGQQQRVALARALAPRPVALLLDEPFSNLDYTMRVDMRREVAGILRESKTTIVLVTHDREEALALADRVAVLNAGRIEQVGTPHQLYHRPATAFVARLLGAANFLPGEVREGSVLTEIGLLSYLATEGEYPDGKRVQVLLRTADLQLRPDDQGTATVQEREFRGADTQYWVSLPSGRVLLCAPKSDPSLDVGQRVNVSPTTERAFVVFNGSD